MRTTSLARGLGSVVLVTSLGLGLAACGSDDSDASADTSSAASDDSSDDAATDEADTGAEETDGGSLEELSAGEFYPAVYTALQDAGSFAFASTSDGNGETTTMSGQARWTEDGMDMSATSSGAAGVDMVMLDKVVYIKGEGMGMGDKWMKVDLSDESGSLLGMVAKATDPKVMFEAMKDPKSLELLGEEEVDGVATNHYRISVDPEQYMKAMGFPASMSSFLPEEMSTDMWVDADNLPRKFSQDVEVPGQGGAGAMSSTTEGTYSDFGMDVDIEAPPESEVTDAPSFGG